MAALTLALLTSLPTDLASGVTLESVMITTLVGSSRAIVGLSSFKAPCPMCTGYVPPGVSTISLTIAPARRPRRRRVIGLRRLAGPPARNARAGARRGARPLCAGGPQGGDGFECDRCDARCSGMEAPGIRTWRAHGRAASWLRRSRCLHPVPPPHQSAAPKAAGAPRARGKPDRRYLRTGQRCA